MGGVDVLLIENPLVYDVPCSCSTPIEMCIKNGDYSERIRRFFGELNPDEVFSENAGQIAVRGNYIGFTDYRRGKISHIGGERTTEKSCYDERRNAYLFGCCNIYGVYTTDEETLASILQDSEIGNRYYFHNYSNMAQTDFMRMHDVSVYQGDLIIYCVRDNARFRKAGMELLSLLSCYENNIDRREELWWDRPDHISGKMNKVLARAINDELLRREKQRRYLNGDTNRKKIKYVPGGQLKLYDLWLKSNTDLDRWVQKELARIDGRTGSVGCIVMNANPFTKGHRYLIEYALSRVDVLLLFVLEEDKSSFSFNDRWNMVVAGTKDLDNVIMIPSGRYIISTDTLPGYFEKGALQDVVMDATQDILLFCEVISPLFGISTRFVGEEPEDMFTRQYNRQMKERFDEYGIKLDVIPRYQTDGDIVSGTKVRSMYNSKEWDGLKRFVGEPILQYMKQIDKHDEC